MDLQLDGRFRNRLYISVLAIIIIFLIIVISQASQQNTHYLEQYQIFTQMVESGKQGQPAQVIYLYDKLEPGFNDNFQSLLTVAYAYAQQNNLNKAQKYLDQAKLDSPGLVDSPEFLALYGNILLLQKDYPNAKIYLQKCLASSPNETTKAQVERMLANIDG